MRFNGGIPMKKVRLFYLFGMMLIVSLAIFSCSDDDGGGPTGDDGGSNGGNGGGNSIVSLDDTRDAYDTVMEFAVAKQIMLLDYARIMTDGYNAGFAENDLDEEDVDELFESIYSLMEYEQDVDAAITLIESDAAAKAAGMMAVEGLGSAMKDFFTWASGSGTRNRNRILQVASNMSESQRTFLYDNLRPNWKSQFSSENDFWKKLEDGELDMKAPQMYNDFYHLDQDKSDFGITAGERGLTIQKIAHREGAEGVTKGAKLMVEVVKTVAPSTAKGMEYVEKADEYKEKAQKAYLDPTNFIKDEIKSKVAGKIGDLIDVDGAVDGGAISEGLGTALKASADLVFGTDDSSALAGQGIDWGIAKIKQVTGSATGSDIAVAQAATPGTVPEVVLAKGSKDEDLKVVVPKGKWNVKVVTEEGRTEEHEDKEIESGQETEIEAPMTFQITISPDSDTAEVGSAVNFSATVKGTPPEGVTYMWTFGDNSTPMGTSWNGAMSKTYPKVGTYTVKVQLQDENGAVLAEDTATAVITDPADTTVTSYLHDLKYMMISFSAPFEGPDGVETRSIVIDTRNYSGTLTWDGLSFSVSYTKGETTGTIRGKFANEKYKIETLDISEHEVYEHWYYENGFPLYSEEWIYDKDIIVNDFAIDKYSMYGTNGLTKTVTGSDVGSYVSYVKYVSTSPDPEEDPKTFSTPDWSNKENTPQLKIYFFD